MCVREKIPSNSVVLGIQEHRSLKERYAMCHTHTFWFYLNQPFVEILYWLRCCISWAVTDPGYLLWWIINWSCLLIIIVMVLGLKVCLKRNTENQLKLRLPLIPWSSSFVDTPSGNENILFADLHTIMGVLFIFFLCCVFVEWISAYKNDPISVFPLINLRNHVNNSKGALFIQLGE